MLVAVLQGQGSAFAIYDTVEIYIFKKIVNNAKALAVRKKLDLHNAQDVREGLIDYKFALLAAHIAHHRSGGRKYHDETLPADIYKQTEFCSLP
jgi:thiamine biosynthesis protein ThiC